jgi:hypothetical protein
MSWWQYLVWVGVGCCVFSIFVALTCAVFAWLDESRQPTGELAEVHELEVRR